MPADTDADAPPMLLVDFHGRGSEWNAGAVSRDPPTARDEKEGVLTVDLGREDSDFWG